ncbi:MAG: DUF547 domain-containing protein [Verrucomicrobiota bacterium]
MKTTISLLLALILSPALNAFDHSDFDSLLKRYVDSKGQVNYATLKSNRAGLDSYLEKTGAVPESTFKSWSRDEQLAFLINVYNAETLQLIVDNYPTESIKKLGGLLSSPWKKKEVILFGEKATLDQVEHDIIRVDYADEPRIHFALVCAAKGCPPLRAEAFVASRLDAQLDNQTKTFLTDNEKNRIEGETLYLSSIFDWYGDDFTKNGRTLNDYVDPYMNGSAVGKKIEFTTYDWSLNAQ